MIETQVLSTYYKEFISVASENSNFILPALAVFSVVMLLIGKVYYKIRTRFPIKVNCWFCNSYTSVPYNSANSWYCPHCDQYNGFCSDGSYNRVLTEQFNEKFNSGLWCTKSTQKIPNVNSLCRFCNLNLELKVRQLAQFVPINQANYDEEITLYSDQLERVYRLCTRCQGVLDKTLMKKQELYMSNLQQPFKPLDQPQINAKHRHPLHSVAIATLAVCLLLSTLPHSWLDQLVNTYPTADYTSQLIKHLLTAVPPYLLPMLGVGVQVLDCVFMRDANSVVNLFLWTILLMLPYSPLKIDHLISVVQTLASIVFLITSLIESRPEAAPKKPAQFQKLNEKVDKPKNPKLSEPLPTKVPSAVSQPTSRVEPLPTKESTPEDLGFGKLNVSPRRVTRSQSKPFQMKNYTAKQNEMFRPKPVNLTPPKLQLDKSFEFQIPVTRCSSQSSGFVSLSHQKDFDDEQASINENLESVSQCGAGAMSMYRSQFHSPVPYQFSPFSQFPPYAVMHFTPPPFDKVFSYANMPFYEPSLNLSSSTLTSQRSVQPSWFQAGINSLFPLFCVFLITSHIVILWKVFGEEYFKVT
ncbi:transmembrane protein 201-like isoform X1 [Macrosteles quadrilineatus]|uniref:transmembrane protein 201-like isoform X1 n=1 Tax=Macrosteles quadrilineatus TaxID=74068 RepID=UPI0023E34A33|nr:transmembrane protein 201-like isoform X1 [Macrosteles quadrilineatus]